MILILVENANVSFFFLLYLSTEKWKKKIQKKARIEKLLLKETNVARI